MTTTVSPRSDSVHDGSGTTGAPLNPSLHLQDDPRPDLHKDHALWQVVLSVGARLATSLNNAEQAARDAHRGNRVQAGTTPRSDKVAQAGISPDEMRQVLGLLHGLRCLGARLYIRRTRRGPSLFLDISPLTEPALASAGSVSTSSPERTPASITATCTEESIPGGNQGDVDEPSLWKYDRQSLRSLWLEPHVTAIQLLFAQAFREYQALTKDGDGKEEDPPSVPGQGELLNGRR